MWRRIKETGKVIQEQEKFRCWMLLEHLEDLGPLFPVVGRTAGNRFSLEVKTLEGNDPLRYLVTGSDGRALMDAVLKGISKRREKQITRLRDDESVLFLPPEEQYLVSTGRTYFKDLAFDELHRMQFDLETTGLDPKYDRIFMISIRVHAGETSVLESKTNDDAGEADLIRRFVDYVRVIDPDVLENHNLHGFDLPFLYHRARKLKVSLTLGRLEGMQLGQRSARRGMRSNNPNDKQRIRFVAPGRELIDTLDAVLRHDFSTREFPSHGLKAVAKHLGIAEPDREYVRGDSIYTTYLVDPDRIRRYATDDVKEVAALSHLLGGAAYALAQMVPRRYERLADAGPATGVIDPLLVRAYIRSGVALPKHESGDGTPHSGAALYLFASGVAHRVVKADVASLYPSLMRTYRIGSARDNLGVLLALIDKLVERRLESKAKARSAIPGSTERHIHDALSAALKIVVNSAYGYLGAGRLTRFSDVHAANEITRRGREVLGLLCRELAVRGVTLLEADTDGVYFSVPSSWNEQDELRVVEEVGTLLPPLIHLEFEGRYAAMLSHEPKNYALLSYNGNLQLRGVAFRSSRSESFGERFLQAAIEKLLLGDIVGVRVEYLKALDAIRNRTLPTYDVSSNVRLTKSPETYLRTRLQRRELSYEALLSSGQTTWRVGDRIRVYRRRGHTNGGTFGIIVSSEEDASVNDPRDYDVDYYARLLKTTYAQRLARGLRADDFAVVFSDPDQLALFPPLLASIRPILTTLHPEADGEELA